MRRWSFLLALLAPLFLAVLPRAVEAATQVGDVYLNTGEILEDVEFEVKPRLRAITVYGPEGERSFSFLDLSGIEVDGEDVTAELTGRRSTIEQLFRGGSARASEGDTEGSTESTATGTPRVESPPVEPIPLPADAGWISKDDPAYKRAHSPTHRATLSGGGMYSLPIGDYFEGIEAGVGFQASAFIPFNERAGIRVAGAKTGLRWDDAYGLIPLDPGVTVLSQDIQFDSWRFTVSAQFYQHLDARSDKLSMFYMYTGVGVWSGTRSIDATATDGSTTETLSDKETQSKFILGNGAGLVAMLSESVGLDFSIEWDLIFVGTDETTFASNDIQYASEIAFQAGLVFMIR